VTQAARKTTVLLVDDCSTVRAVLHSILKNAGYSVIGEAPDGRTALRMVEQLAPDIVALDMRMPEMSGLDVLRKLQDSRHKTVTLVVSANNDKETVRQSFALGALGYVTKPFTEERVLSVFGHVASIITRRQIGAAAQSGAWSSARRTVIIDDSQADRSQLKRILEDGGYVVADETEGGLAGLVAVEKNLPDFVCHSVDLSEVGGLNVLACIRAVHPDLPVIIVSSHNDSDTIMQAIQGGVKGYIIKPFDSEIVLSSIRRILPAT